MNRLQVSLTQTQYEFLKSEAFVTGQSMAAVLRELLDKTIQNRQQEILRHDPIWQVIGVAAEIDGPTDVSTNVDKYLYGELVESAGSSASSRTVAEDSDEYPAD